MNHFKHLKECLDNSFENGYKPVCRIVNQSWIVGEGFGTSSEKLALESVSTPWHLCNSTVYLVNEQKPDIKTIRKMKSFGVERLVLIKDLHLNGHLTPDSIEIQELLKMLSKDTLLKEQARF